MRIKFSRYGEKKLARLILLTGLLVGTLDILSAFVNYYLATGNNPLFVLKYIASGAFGEPALKGGAAMIITGFIFHYFFAFFFTILFFWLYGRVVFLRKNKILTGVVYGIFTWIIMNLLVIQLSNAPHGPVKDMKADKIIKAIAILIVMIGLPLSFIANKYFSGDAKNIVKAETS